MDVPMSHVAAPLVACHECGLLLREITLPPGETAVCCCCGATLYRNSPDSIRRTLALTLAAAVFFIVANSYPILGIEIQGNRNAATLAGAVQALWHQQMYSISVLVCVTAILVPALEISLLLYLLTPLHREKQPPGTALILRFMTAIKPWGMVEVFMLGLLVSLVKLQSDFAILPGVALWSFAVLTLLLAAVATSFNPRDVWVRLDYPSKRRHAA